MILETIQISQNATLTAILHGPSEEMQSDTALRRPAVVICPGGVCEFCPCARPTHRHPPF